MMIDEDILKDAGFVNIGIGEPPVWHLRSINYTLDESIDNTSALIVDIIKHVTRRYDETVKYLTEQLNEAASKIND